MNGWLNYHHLYYFWVISQEGSVSGAARKLRLGQATLSTQLKQFEESLGTPLFDRRRKRLVLNEHGRFAAQYAKEIFNLGSEMKAAIEGRATPTRTQVLIGGLDSIPKTLFFKLTKFCLSASKTSVSIFEGSETELFRMIKDFKLDLILLNSHPTISNEERLRVKTLGKEDVCIYGTSRFKHLKKHFPASLSGAPLILPTHHSRLRQDVENYLRDLEIVPDIVAETQDTSLQKVMGSNGLGLIPLPETAAEPYVRNRSLIRIGKLPNVYEEYFLVVAKRQVENRFVSEVYRKFSLA